MAEFCLECLNKISDTHYKPRHVKFFSGVDLCEECGKYKKCVARINILGELADLRQARKNIKKNTENHISQVRKRLESLEKINSNFKILVNICICDKIELLL